MQNANLASLIKCVLGDLLALRTAAEFFTAPAKRKTAAKMQILHSKSLGI